MRHSLKWFKNRIGKRIYRDDNHCCDTCDEVFRNGIVVHDEQHAEYLYMVNCEMDLNYRDNK